MLNVLFLEDTEDDAWTVQRRLRNLATVHVARDRAAFRQALRSRDWDAVLIDMNLPDINGEQAIKTVLEQRPGVPIIIVTGSISYREAVDALKWGAVDCHDKNQLERLEHSLVEAIEKRDLKEKGRRENRLEAIGQLNTGLAHDWNNILQAFLTGPDYLLRSLDKVMSDADRRVLHTMKSMGQRGAEMSAQITKFVRGEGTVMKSIAPEYLLTELRTFVEQTFPKTIRIQTNTVPATSNIRCDPTMIHQVLINLCINARDAMPNGGTISITAQNIGDRVCFEVKDNGTGIEAKVLSEIFKPFFTTKPPGEGTGMGLSISKGIIDDHGGNIAVESGPNGTTFQVYVPIAVAENGDHKKNGEAVKGNRETILIVDDEASMRFMVELSLGDANYKTLSASTGLEALSIFRTQQDIALLLCDIWMPTLTGTELVAALRLQNNKVPVVFMTGDSSQYQESAILPAWNALLIKKPFLPDELLRVINKALVDNRQRVGQPSPP